MLWHTRPLQAPGEDSITFALRSPVKRRNNITCDPGLLSASPGRRSDGLATRPAIAGMAAVVKWLARPHAALTKAEQSTPVASLRGALWVQMFPASTPRSILLRIWASEP